MEIKIEAMEIRFLSSSTDLVVAGLRIGPAIQQFYFVICLLLLLQTLFCLSGVSAASNTSNTKDRQTPAKIQNVHAVKAHIKQLRSARVQQLADKSANDDVQRMYMQAKLLMSQGNTLAALPLLKDCCEMDPEFLSGMTSYGIALQSLGNIKESLVVFRKVVDTAPGKANYWSNLGNAYLLAQEYELAADAFKHSTDLDASIPPVHEAYGFVLGKLGKDKQAKDELMLAVKLDPTATNAWHLLGDVYNRLKQYSDARDSYSEYLKLKPDGSDARDVSSKLKNLPKTSDKVQDQSDKVQDQSGKVQDQSDKVQDQSGKVQDQSAKVQDQSDKGKGESAKGLDESDKVQGKDRPEQGK